MSFEVYERKWAEKLHRLRTPGRRRARQKEGSPPLKRLLQKLPKGSVLLDLGCGESGDVAYARAKGMKAFGVDLFPAIPDSVKANVSELPFASGTVDAVLSHAMISLVKPQDRPCMYEEIARVLKPNGLFLVTFQLLSDGWPLHSRVERLRIIEAGMHKSGDMFRLCDKDKTCAEHEPDLSWAAILKDCYRLDSNPRFRAIGPLLLALSAHGFDIPATSRFSGASVTELERLRKNAIKGRLLDPETGGMELNFLTLYAEDRFHEGNIQLMLDSMVLDGELERCYNDEGEPVYKKA